MYQVSDYPKSETSPRPESKLFGLRSLHLSEKNLYVYHNTEVERREVFGHILSKTHVNVPERF